MGSIMKMNVVHIEGDHMNTIVTSKEDILKTAVSLSGKRAGRRSVSVLSPRHAGSRSARSTTIMTPRLSLSAPRSRASGAKFSTARRTRLYFRMCRPVSNGCTSAWPTAVSSILDSSHCTLSALCRRTRPMANGTCSKSGTIS